MFTNKEIIEELNKTKLELEQTKFALDKKDKLLQEAIDKMNIYKGSEQKQSTRIINLEADLTQSRKENKELSEQLKMLQDTKTIIDDIKKGLIK